MKKVLVFIFLFFGIAFANGNKEDILGTWITAKGDNGNQIIVEFYNNGNKISGKIKGLTMPTYTEGENKGKERMDLNNPDESKKTRKLVGIEFVYSFDFNENNKDYENGFIYNPENGKEYYSYMKIKEDGTLYVRGSIDRAGWFGKTQIWTRYDK